MKQGKEFAITIIMYNPQQCVPFGVSEKNKKQKKESSIVCCELQFTRPNTMNNDNNNIC